MWAACVVVRADVADGQAGRMTAVPSQFDRVGALVNNADVFTQHFVEDMPVGDWDRVLSVNLRETFLCTQVLLGQMLDRESGRLIDDASQLGRIGGAEVAHDDARTAAVISFTPSLACGVSSRGVLVNAIAPGPIHTPLLAGETEQWRRAELADLPIGRFSEVSKVPRQPCCSPPTTAHTTSAGPSAPMAETWCASPAAGADDASWRTGHVIVNDGGISAQGL